MTNRSETFGRLLKGAINAIAAYEGKTAPIVEDELGTQIGVSGASIQRYKAGYLPPEPRPVQILAEAGVRRGFLARPWLTRFLQAARYPNPEALIAGLADALGAPVAATADSLPSGTVALLVTEIAGSIAYWEAHPRVMERALERHDAILRQAIDAYGGHIFTTVGDAVYAVFTTAPAALEAALSAQRVLYAEHWGPAGPLLVRMAIHVGAPQLHDGDYVGPPINRLVRILSAGHGGQILLSLSAQELVADALPPGVRLRDLGAQRLKDLGRPERIFQIVVADLPADFPPLQALDAYHHNLPSQPTALVGREAEVAQVGALLQREDIRLVTLVGPGGVGKTRLGLQVAVERLDAYTDGVTFVALAPVRAVDQVLGAITSALGLQPTPEVEPLAQLKAALARRRALLVLDNVEQVVEAAPLIAELLAAAPTVQVLATSRTPLRLQGEHEFPVPPLALADMRALPPLERLTQVEAVRLFIERAQAVRPDFAVTANNAPLIAEICVRLDGLPLAIELAAARTRLFAPKALLARLDKRLQLLRGGARDLPARQQTLYDAIAWSYDLLDAAEQVLFARLAVFVGGCTLAAAEAVLGDDATDPELLAGAIPTGEVLDGLARLVDRSLVRRVEDEDGEPRFVLLETIREFAQQRLAATGEEGLIQARHARWVRALVEQAEPQLNGPGQLVWYRRLDGEQANLRLALRWCLVGGNATTGAAIVAASWWYWIMRGQSRELSAWLAQSLAGDNLDARTRAALLTGSGWLGMAHPERTLSDGIAPLTSALALWHDLGESWWEAHCLTTLGQFELFGNNDAARARAHLTSGLSLARSLHSPLLCSYVEQELGMFYREQGDRAQAQDHLEAALTYGRASGNRLSVIEPLRLLAGDVRALREQRIVWAEEALTVTREMGFPLLTQYLLVLLTYLYGAAGHQREALHALEESALIARRQGIACHTHEPLIGRGWLALVSGELETAREWYLQGIAAALAEQCPNHQWSSLVGLAQVVARQGRHQQAALCFAAAARLDTAARLTHFVMDTVLPEQTGYADTIAAMRTALGEQGWAEAWAEGERLGVQKALELVLGATPDSEEASPSQRAG